VFMMALTSAFITYFEQLKIVYTEIDVDQVYYDSYATEAGIQDGALIAPGSAFIFTFALWYVGS
ncbi:MAG: hypothetical protein IH840_16935, partial [Candidatus Heimdallarchaeota archaeon]|nr:hypothetical protein [Candidatus Heimdallarchaeota archaeon]